MTKTIGRAVGAKSFMVILASLGWPLFWGMAIWAGFYGLIHQGVLSSPLISRYFSTHPVEYITAAMFFVGSAALVIKAIGVIWQYAFLGTPIIPPAPSGGHTVESCPDLLDRLKQLPAQAKNFYLVRRIRDAIQYVNRKRSVDGLDAELKYLADLDAERLYEGYALVRIVIWATPMMGFLGTVIGITLALGDLSPEALVNSPNEAMEGLLAGLSVAFDTTALALSLSIVLMFAQFLVGQVETQLLVAVDTQVSRELIGRFEQVGTSNDPHLVSVERMLKTVAQSSQELVSGQAAIWRQSIDAAQQQWSQQTDTAGKQLETALAGALRQSLGTHAQHLAETEEAAAERNRQYAERVQNGLAENGKLVQQQQTELITHGRVLLRVVEATGQVISLQQTLNDNLKALAGAKNFEDTVMSLSAAIHLLNTRLGQLPGTTVIDLTSSQAQGHAA